MDGSVTPAETAVPRERAVPAAGSARYPHGPRAALDGDGRACRAAAVVRWRVVGWLAVPCRLPGLGRSDRTGWPAVPVSTGARSIPVIR